MLWKWIDQVLVGVGAGPVRVHISLSLAMRVGGVLEWAWRTFRLGGEPPMTRFGALGLGTTHWYRCSAAEQDFGFVCPVSGDEGLARTIAGFQGR